MLQLTYFKSIGGIRKDCGIEQKNVLKNKVQLFEDKQIFLFFAWGQEKILSLGEFDESKTHSSFNQFF